MSVYAADECDATISPEGLIHIPVVRYINDLFTLDLQILDISGSSIELSLEKIAATAQDCPAESEITCLSPFTLNIVSLAVGSDNYNIILSDDPGLKTKAPQLSGFLNMPYDGKGFNAGTGRHAIRRAIHVKQRDQFYLRKRVFLTIYTNSCKMIDIS